LRKEDKVKVNKPCEAVMLLIDRMDTHPDEFRLEGESKWGHLMSIVRRRVVKNDEDAFIILEDFECEMLWNKFKDAGKKQLHSFVMAKILQGDEDGRSK
jgi:hypothetical protein